jgi:carboxyl-terminal processing protease
MGSCLPSTAHILAGAAAIGIGPIRTSARIGRLVHFAADQTALTIVGETLDRPNHLADDGILRFLLTHLDVEIEALGSEIPLRSLVEREVSRSDRKDVGEGSSPVRLVDEAAVGTTRRREPSMKHGNAMVAARILVAVALVAACSAESDRASDQAEAWLDDVWRIVAEDHYDPELHGLDWPAVGLAYREKLRVAGPDRSTEIINAMLQELNDSHCGFGLPADLAEVASPYVFCASELGIDVRMIGGRAVVTAVDAGSPAAQGGMLPGFVLLAVNGRTIEEIVNSAVLRAPHNEANRLFHKTEAVLRRLCGEPHTTVDLAFLDGGDDRRSVTLRRAQRTGGFILDPSLPEIFVELENRRLDGGICYVRFSAFRPDVPDDVLAAIDECPSHAPMLLDLRGNNGGSAEATAQILSRFVRRPSLAYTRESRGHEIPIVVEPAATRHEGPVVILVDELSISAAENLSGIMQHLGIATVVGQRTPGQVLWGEGRALEGGAMVFVPTAKLVYPDGLGLEGRGVTPDLAVNLRREDLLNGVDTQVAAAVAMLRTMQEDDPVHRGQ